uniref:Pre-glycoprotein polyprotein GP complex n=1 Tax=Machupo virus TaxID=3052317 RepID=A0A1U8ZS71_MACHU|nr:pre-glycoprotein polyprotein GP complex [Mammarenavirus machupoense]
MGQLISFLQEIPVFLQEALNIALVAVSLIAVIKGIINLYKSGLFQLIFFLLLAGRSCSDGTFKIGLHTEFQSVTLTMQRLLANHSNELPSLCMLNNSFYYMKGGVNTFLIRVSDISVLMKEHDVSIYEPEDLGNCLNKSDSSWAVHWFSNALGHDWLMDPPMLCRNKTKREGSNIEFNISKADDVRVYGKKIRNGMRHLFRGFHDPCEEGKKCYLTINQCGDPSSIDYCGMGHLSKCQFDHVNTLHFLVRSKTHLNFERSLKAFFSWSLTDSSGKDMPGGYCLEEWMLIAAKMKCFGNTAVAKCNQNHDSEFCDMLRLFDYNKNAIKTLNDESKKEINLLSQTVNALISDNLLMKNKIKELMSIPYCNYTKFWYVNHTLTGQHTLPRCWLIRNGSYLNTSEFRNDWILESDHLISEMLSKEYAERQGKTPITLVDICFWSTVFFTASLFLHLVGVPTHRHLKGEACPLPHRLDSFGGCRCGKYPRLRKPTIWHKRH